jgi:hypothetical protein
MRVLVDGDELPPPRVVAELAWLRGDRPEADRGTPLQGDRRPVGLIDRILDDDLDHLWRGVPHHRPDRGADPLHTPGDIARPRAELRWMVYPEVRRRDGLPFGVRRGGELGAHRCGGEEKTEREALKHGGESSHWAAVT